MKITKILPALFVLIIFSFQNISALDCFAFTTQQALDEATVVFIGKVINVERVNPDPYRHYYKIKFIKEKAWKQENKNGEIVIYTFNPYLEVADNTGYRFEEGIRYLIYTKKNDDGKLIVENCNVKKLEDADKEINELNRLTEKGGNTLQQFWNWLKNLFSKQANSTEPTNDSDCGVLFSQNAQDNCCAKLHKDEPIFLCMGNGWVFDENTNECKTSGCGGGGAVYYR